MASDIQNNVRAVLAGGPSLRPFAPPPPPRRPVGLGMVCLKPQTSEPHQERKVYLCLRRGAAVERSDQSKGEEIK